MNWLDILLVTIMVVTAVVGIFKGFVKQVIGLVAVVAGLVLASFYYERTAGLFETFIHNRLLSNFLGFLLLFVLVMIAGAVAGHLLTKAMKGPLAFANRLFGAVFGFLKAVLICGIIVFALVSFEVAKPALETSAVAPACLGVARAVVNMIPQDLRARFNSSYKRIRESGGKHGQEI
ncbi:MAG: CvpA family protein [Candidatus Aminicenantes bacterium]|jgi:membrane protein required for colicin V production|nr:CvpA family protein [Candidatus Aminicenantes bacterium]NLH77042.1 CvpA family protein [Acidobacteriota bacterium]